jgi:hypothetical protein
MVTLPYGGFEVPFRESLEMYQHFIQDWKLPQKMHSTIVGLLPNGHQGFGIHPIPLSFTYTTKSEFIDMKEKGLPTGWE